MAIKFKVIERGQPRVAGGHKKSVVKYCTYGSKKFSTTFTYDNKGRLSTRIHPSGIVETSNYNSNGYLASISAGGETRFTVTAMNARQQITAATYGTSLLGVFGFDDYGYPTHSKAQASGVYKQDYRYSFNTVTGNLNSRQNYLRSKSESFAYDNLDRLDTVTGPQNLKLDYAANGNINVIKYDADTLIYGYNHATKPYALTYLEASDGLIPNETQIATYTSFDQVSTIGEGDYYATFTYNSDDQRAKMLVTDLGSTILTRWYVGSRYIKEIEGAVTKEYTWIGGDAYSAPVIAVKQGFSTAYYYLLRDYLGNITHVANTSNTVTAEYSYDAWGRRRDKDDWSYTLSSEPELLAGRSFTSHEYLPEFGLINMNGRLYDPVVDRFLSPDENGQMPGFTQSYNRYSYTLNNPLKYIDPTGEKWKWKWLNPFYWFGELMQWINDETEPLRDAMVKLGIPDFSVGATVNGAGNVNFNVNYRGQEVFNSENIDKSNASQKVNQIINDVRQAHGQAWHASSSGIDAISGAAIDAGPYIGRVWKEGLPKIYYNNQSILVISNSSNSYVDINDKRLYWEFADYLHNKNSNLSIRYHPINTRLDGTGLMLMEWLLVPSLVPFPNWQTKEKWDYFKDSQKVDYYRKAKIIKY